MAYVIFTSENRDRCKVGFVRSQSLPVSRAALPHSSLTGFDTLPILDTISQACNLNYNTNSPLSKTFKPTCAAIPITQFNHIQHHNLALINAYLNTLGPRCCWRL